LIFMSRILDNLYLGSYADAKNQVFLKKNNITHIVTVGAELKTPYLDSYKYLYIAAMDSPDFKLKIYFDQIAEFIHEAIETEKGTVLVHCFWGISRSTTSVLCYLIKYHKMTPIKARRMVKSKRSIIYPNEGFWHQLETYARELGVLEPVINRKVFAGNLVLNTMANFHHGNNSILNLTEEEKKEDSQLTASREQSLIFHSYSTKPRAMAHPEDYEYCCKSCGYKLFKGNDIVHNALKSLGGLSLCNSIFINYMNWMGNLRTNMGKMFCPNSKCGSILGFCNQSGGKCTCGTRLDKIYSIYPLRVTYAKAKSESNK